MPYAVPGSILDVVKVRFSLSSSYLALPQLCPEEGFWTGCCSGMHGIARQAFIFFTCSKSGSFVALQSCLLCAQCRGFVAASQKRGGTWKEEKQEAVKMEKREDERKQTTCAERPRFFPSCQVNLLLFI